MPTDYFATTINDLIASVIAIETELGIVPAGAYATVRTRLDILEARINNPFAPSPDVTNPFFIGISGVSIQAGVGDPNVDDILATPGSLFLREDVIGGLNVYSFGTDGYWGLVGAAPAPSPPIIGLGTAATFGVLASSTVTNTGGTNIGGDLGLSPGTSVTGFPPGAFTGTEHIADSPAAAAQLAVTAAFVEGNALLGGITISGDLGGQTLTTGVYKSASTIGITGTLTLDGQNNPNAYWVFQIGSALTTASSAIVALINGASAANIFWLIGSSATLGTGTVFNGTIIAQASITANTGVNITGRLLAQTAAVTLDDNQIVLPSSGGGGSFTAGGDLSGTSTSQTVIGIQGNPVPAPTGTDTVLTWTGSALAWDAASGGGNVIVFQPGGTPGGNVYTTWATAYAALITIKGFRILEVDQTFGSAVVPAGAYTVGPDTLFRAAFTDGFTTLSISEGATFDTISEMDNINIVATNTATPIVTSNATAVALRMRGSTITPGSAPFFADADEVRVELDAGSAFITGVSSVIHMTSFGDAILSILGADVFFGPSTVQTNTISDDGTGELIVTVDNTGVYQTPQTGFTGTLNGPTLISKLGNVFIYREGGVAAANVYTSFAAALAARSVLPGYAVIQFDNSITSLNIPAGTYAIPDGTLFYGTLDAQGSGGEGPPTINVADNVFFNPPPTMFEQVQFLTNNSSTANVTVNGLLYVTLRNASIQTSSGAAPLYATATGSSSQIGFFFWDSSNMNPGAGAIVNVDSTSHIAFNLFSNSTLYTGAIAGTGTVNASYDDSSQVQAQGGFSGTLNTTLLSQALSVNYSPAVPGNWSPPPAQVASALDQLAARSVGSGITQLTGDVTAGPGTGSVAATVHSIQGVVISGTPSTGQVLEATSPTAASWQTPASGFTAGGDLSGTSTNQNVINIHGASVPIAGSLTTGNVLQVSGASALTYAPVNLAGGANFVTGTLPTGNQAAQNMGGDVTGTTAASTVAKIQGNTVTSGALVKGDLFIATTTTNWAATAVTGDVSFSTATPGLTTVLAINGTTVPATPTANQVLVATSGTAATWEQISNAQISPTAAIAGSKIAPAFGTQNVSTTGTLSAGATTVTSINLSVKTVTTATYAIDTSEADFFIYCNRAGVITLTLPAPTAGRYLIVKDISGAAGTNNITVNPHSSETIDGGSSATLNTNYGSLSFSSDGTNWWIG